MLLQTNSYIVPKERRAEHARLLRRFRQVLLRVGCDLFEVYEQTGPNWTAGDGSGRYVQIMRFRDRKHQRQVHAAEQNDPAAQQLIAEFCELVNIPYQQQQGLLAVGYYQGVMDVPAGAIARQAAVATGFEGMPATSTGFGLPAAAAAATAMGFGVAEGFGQQNSESEADEEAAAEEEVADQELAEEAVDEEAVDEEAVDEEEAIEEEEAVAEEEPAEADVDDLFADALEAETAGEETETDTEETKAELEEAAEDSAEAVSEQESTETDETAVDELALSDLQSLDFGLEEDAEPAAAEVAAETEESASETESVKASAATQTVNPSATAAAESEEVGSESLLDGNWADGLLNESPTSQADPDAEPLAIETSDDESNAAEAGTEADASAVDIFGLEEESSEGEEAVDDGEATHVNLNGAATAATIAPIETSTGEDAEVESEEATAELSAEGLPMHLVADEAEIEILYEALPDFSHASANSAQSDELGGDEIDAALNEALQD